jgi:hypothetical protein
MPDKTGTVALLSDITDLVGTGGAGAMYLDELLDVTITNQEDIDLLTYSEESTSWVNTPLSSLLYVESTYTELNDLANTGGLIPNVLYAFDYQTIHNIPANTGGATGYFEGLYNDTTVDFVTDDSFSKNTFTPETEKLIIRAVSGTSFAMDAVSITHPEDIVHYDFFNNLTEDGLRSRKGKVIFRHDTKRNLSAHYDWRNVLFRRYRNLASDISGIPNYFNDTGCSLEETCVTNIPVTTSETLYNKTIRYRDVYTDSGVDRYYNSDYNPYSTILKTENRLPLGDPAENEFNYTYTTSHKTTVDLNAVYSTVGSTTLTSNVNEPLVLEGNTVGVGQLVLVKNQNAGASEETTDVENGIYQLTQQGIVSSTPWILTRATNFDDISDAVSSGQVIKVNDSLATYWSIETLGLIEPDVTPVKFEILSTLGFEENFTQVGYFETFNDGVTYNDFLTFSNDRPSTAPSKYSNIHIGKMEYTNSTLAQTEGMIKVNDIYALGIKKNIIKSTSPELGKHYSDVVFFPNPSTIFITNVNIGENSYGLTFSSHVSFVNIGDGCTNITIGSSFNSATQSANQNINIGNFNRNIHINQDVNIVEIGNGNKNIALGGGASRDIKIGNYNQQIYGNDLQFVTIGDSNLRTVFSGDIKYVTIGNNNQDNHIINCVYNFSMKDNNYDNVVKFMLNGSFKSNNVRNKVMDSRWVDLEINVRDSLIISSWFVEIDEINQFEIATFDGTAGNTIISSKYINIGKESYYNSISGSTKLEIGYNSRNNEVRGNKNYIGDNCQYNRIIGNENYIGHNSNSNFIITESDNNKLGMFTYANIINNANNNFIDDYSTNNMLKGNCDNNIIGKYSNSNFFEDSSHNIIGNDSNLNIFNTTNIKYILTVDTTLNYALDGGRNPDKLIIDANTANQISNISTIILGDFSNIGSHYNNIGDNSSNNHFISSSQNQVGNESNSNRFGGEVNETFANTSGCGAGGNEVCPIVGSDYTILLNKINIEGELSNKNIIGNNSSYNEFIGGYGATNGLVTSQYFSDPAVDSAFQNNYDTIHSQIGNIPFTYINDFDGLLLGGGYPGDARTRFFSLGHSYNRIGDNTDRIRFNGSNGSYYNSIISTSNEMIITGTLNNVSVVINGEWEQRVAYNYDPKGVSYTGYSYVDSPSNLPSVYAGTDFVTGNYSNISVHLRDTADNSLWYQDITSGTLNTPNQFN